MKHLTLTAMSGLFCACFLLTSCAQQSSDQESYSHDEAVEEGHAAGHGDQEMAPDAVTASPEYYSLLHEDERVRIIEMKLPAGAKDNLHRHPDEAGYFITGSTVRINPQGSDPMEVALSDGQPFSFEGSTHFVENIGTSDLHAIIFEIAAGARDSAGVAPAGMGAHETSPDVYSVLHEDNRVRILEMKLAAGQSDNDHVHPAEAAYFLTGGKAKIHLANGEIVEAEVPDGGTLSNPSWSHRVENVGDSDIHVIVVELIQPAM